MDTVKKIVKIAYKIAYQLFMIMCILLILIVVLQKFSNNNQSVAGYRIFRVITGSMEPEYDIGQVVISKEVSPKSIEVGDDIVYLGQYGDYNGRIIMHQVTQIDKDEEGNLTFHAKGLNSGSIEDPQIKPSQIYGVVQIKSGILTLLYDLATSIYSAFVIITILVLNVFVSFKFSGKGKIQQLEEYLDDEEIEEEEDEDNAEYEDDEEDVDNETADDSEEDGESAE